MTKMNRRKSILAVLRRQRDRLGRFVVAAFAVASFTVSGAPCFAMASVETHAGDRATSTHAHGHEHHGSSMDHGHAGHAVGHDDGSQPQGSPYCPHCLSAAAMPGHEPSSAHSFCSAFDEAVDQASCTASPSFAKHVLMVATFAMPPPLVFHPPPKPSPRAIASHRSAIALNLRNCVFLI